MSILLIVSEFTELLTANTVVKIKPTSKQEPLSL